MKPMLGLTLFAVLTGVALKDRRARMALAFGIAGFALSFGPAFPLYGFPPAPPFEAGEA